MFRVNLTVKLAASYLLVAALIVGPTLLFLRATFLSTLERLEAGVMEPRAEALRDELEKVPLDHLDEVDAAVHRFATLLQLRVTLIQPDGRPLADSEVPLARIGDLQNHLDRPEVQKALHGQFGYDSRVSLTVHDELVYGAVPLPARGPVRLVVRVARRMVSLREGATSALLTMRLSTGVGVTVALLLSLGAAVYVSRPLRRMRDTARAFAEGRWVDVPRVETRDELEDLSIALDDLGRKLQQQLILHGANESLLTQTVRALPRPALLLDPDFKPLEVNGALRAVGELTPANEGEALTALLRTPSLEAARHVAIEKGLPVDLNLPLPGRPAEGHVPGTLVPLTRPVGGPFWLLIIGLDEPFDEESGTAAPLELLERIDRTIDSLVQSAPSSRHELAELRVRTDELAVVAGRPAPIGVELVPIGSIIARAVAEVAALFPDRPLVTYAPPDPGVNATMIAESERLAERAVRALLRTGVAGTPSNRTVELTIELHPTQVQLEIRGAASELGETGRLLVAFAQAVGGSAGRRPTGERSIVRLALPRA